jgi:hypothetical protein
VASFLAPSSFWVAGNNKSGQKNYYVDTSLIACLFYL